MNDSSTGSERILKFVPAAEKRPRFYDFGPFRVDALERQLYRNGETVPLTPKTLDLLVLLVERHGQIVEKKTVMATVWPDTFVEESNLTQHVSRLRKALGNASDEDEYIETIPRRGYRFVAQVVENREAEVPRGSEPSRIRFLAIVPFVNASRDADTDYLSDGITDEIINTLSQVPELRVLARSTVFRFKNRETDPKTLGRELRVDGLVFGELRQIRDLVTVKVELVRASDGTQLWGRQYNRTMADLAAVQQEIARDVSEQLRIRLSADQAQRISRQRTRNPAAYQAYLKGLYYWHQRPGGSAKALAYFQEAVRIDPGDALAHAGVAMAYDTMGSWEAGQLHPQVAFPRAREAAQQALQLDPNLAEAYAARAWEELHYARNFEKSEELFRKAIALRPAYTTAHHWYSHLLIAQQRFDESFRESQQALELEPLDPAVQGHMAFHYVYSHQPDEAIDQSSKLIELMPNNFWAHYFRGLALLEKNALPEAIAGLRKAHAIIPTATLATAALGHVLGLAGERAEAASILNELETRSGDYVSPFDRAVVRLALSDRGGALRELDQALEEGNSSCVYFSTDPRLERLRGDPRFEALLARTRQPSGK